MSQFTELSVAEQQDIDGGIIGIIIAGAVILVAGFALGYGLARWLG